MSGLAQWCYRRRRTVILAWLFALVVLGGATGFFGTGYNDSFALPGTESTKALDLLTKAFPQQSGEQDTIVWKATSGSVTDGDVQAAVTALLAKVASTHGVASVTSPYTPTGVAQISRDGSIAYATVVFDFPQDSLDLPVIKRVISDVDSAGSANVEVEAGGPGVQQAEQVIGNTSELIGVAAAAVVIFLAFGSLFAAIVPLLVALIALGTGQSAIGLLSHLIAIGTVGPTLAALIGLGVGIDYALFIVTRHRSGLKSGLSVEESVVKALNTSGRAVLFAGTTVCVALLGLLVLRISFLNGMGIASAVVVAFTVLAAVTFLPALLGFMGLRVLSRSERRALAESDGRPVAVTGPWVSFSRWVGRHPVVLGTGAAIVLLAIAAPTLALRLGSSDAGNYPTDTTMRRSYDLLAEGFGPGFNGPLQLVATVHDAQDRQAFQNLAATVGKDPDVALAAVVPTAASAHIAIMQVVPDSSPQAKATSDLIDRLRTGAVPAAEQGTTMQVYVGGLTAIFDDFAAVLTGKLPAFLAVVITLGFLLLMLAFRSLLVPLVSAVMNVLGALAAFGVVVAVFQWGWGASALGLGGPGPVEAFLPVIMLSLLFGLSMDYQVFLVSRMHEEWVHTGDNERAVTVGQAATGRVITAAGAIMIFVFASFVLGGQRVIAEFGIGLAAAVLLDAFIIRTFLVPSVMHMLGAANWWLPPWLDQRMPHLSVEPVEDLPGQPPPDNPEEAPEAATGARV